MVNIVWHGPNGMSERVGNLLNIFIVVDDIGRWIGDMWHADICGCIAFIALFAPKL